MAYTDKSTIQKYLGIDISAALDSFIDTLIASATDYIETYCGDSRFGRRVFEAPSPDTAVARKFDGNDGVKFHVGDLREITSMSINGTQYTKDVDFVLCPANPINEPYRWLELIQPGGAVNSRSALASYYEFAWGQQNVIVTGKWGFSATPPASITLAATRIVGAMIKENIGDQDVKEIKSETLGDYSVTYQDISKIANAIGVNAMLDKFKRPAVAQNFGTIKI